LKVADVTFSKAKLDNDDGRLEYEIEFFRDGVEYDYTIDAVNGSILECDSEYQEADDVNDDFDDDHDDDWDDDDDHDDDDDYDDDDDDDDD
jgi:calsequestrin-1